MPSVREALVGLQFNGQDASTDLRPYLQGATYTDIAAGSSDEVSITLHNFEIEWLSGKMPKCGDTVGGGFFLKDWTGRGKTRIMPLGIFTMDSIAFSGGPLEAQFTALSVPADSSFQIRNRTQTWEDTTLAGIAGELCGRYGMSLDYNAPTISIKAVEQSQQTDSQFLMDQTSKYGLKMKIYRKKLVIYDPGILEAQGPVVTLKRNGWIDDGWKYDRCLEGVYTGARVSYKREDDDEEISIYVGFKAEDAPDARTMFINETCADAGEAEIKAKGEVNLSNEKAETISGDIFPNTSVVSGVCIQLEGLGQASGKYFVDKVTFDFSESGTKQTVEAHKVQERL